MAQKNGAGSAGNWQLSRNISTTPSKELKIARIGVELLK